MILRWEVEKGYFYWFRLPLLHIVDPDVGEVGSDDPSGLLRVWQTVIVHLCLLVWSHAIVASLRFVQGDAQRLLLD